jgi:Putative Flp pilus-assembly TadE/G-like
MTEPTTSARARTQASERGAVLLHISIALLAIMGFTSLVLDYGIFWVARRQAQNAADAGALAAALSLAFESFDDFSPTGPAYKNAVAAATANRVWGEAPAATPVFPCQGLPEQRCAQVDVFRDSLHGNALPTFFAQLVGISAQNVRASAEARALQANATDCLRPWAIADKWNESDPGGWTDSSVFDLGPASADVYDPPTTCAAGDRPCSATAGTGFQVSSDYGRRLTLTFALAGPPPPGQPTGMPAGWFLPLALAAAYETSIKSCVGTTYRIGETVNIDVGLLDPGSKGGPTIAAAYTDPDSLRSLDPTAYWDASAFGGKGAVISTVYGPNQSPRIVPVAVINHADYLAAWPTYPSTVQIQNIVGFFVENVAVGVGLTGYLTALPGRYLTGTPTVDQSQAFLMNIALVR